VQPLNVEHPGMVQMLDGGSVGRCVEGLILEEARLEAAAQPDRALLDTKWEACVCREPVIFSGGI
jgi:hypothetical protein